MRETKVEKEERREQVEDENELDDFEEERNRAVIIHFDHVHVSFERFQIIYGFGNGGHYLFQDGPTSFVFFES